MAVQYSQRAMDKAVKLMEDAHMREKKQACVRKVAYRLGGIDGESRDLTFEEQLQHPEVDGGEGIVKTWCGQVRNPSKESPMLVDIDGALDGFNDYRTVRPCEECLRAISDKALSRIPASL